MHFCHASCPPRAQYSAAFAKHCGKLAGLPLTAISRDQVADVLRPFWRRPTAGTGMKVRSLLEHVFAANDIEPNPATWSRLQHILSRETVATNNHEAMAPADVPALMAEQAACEGQAGEVARALRFCILTATRTQETLDMDSSEVHMNGVAGSDYIGPTWLIPGARMKKGREHAVPLTSEMLALIGRPLANGRATTATARRHQSRQHAKASAQA
jgi:integrase